MPSTLGYWSIRGLANYIRLLLEYVGEAYEEKRYNLKDETGPAEWFGTDKPRLLKEGVAFPNLPYYIDGDVKLTQSNVIMRYIGDKYNLSGKDGKEKYEVMVLEQQVSDMRMAFARLCYNQDFDKLKEEYLTKTLPTHVKNFSEYLGSKPFLYGAEITYPDFHFYDILSCNLTLDPGCIDKYENLKDYMTRFENLPKIKDYMASPKYISWPINGPMAKFGGQ
jgi:glutathione S-transferase